MIGTFDRDVYRGNMVNRWTVNFTDLISKDGKRFIVFKQVIEHIPGVDALVYSHFQVKLLFVTFGKIERGCGDGFASKIDQVSYP